MGPLRLAVEVIRGRWFTVFASFLIMSAAGGSCLFPVYAKDIKSSLGYNQKNLNTLSFFMDANVDILSGLINEVIPPWVVLLVGAITNLGGYLMIYLAITGRVSPPTVGLMCVYIVFGAQSQSFAKSVSLVTCTKNFPESKEAVWGLLKGSVGLSGAIITQLYLAFYGEDSKSLVLFIAWLPSAILIVSLPTIRNILRVVHNPNELTVFNSFLYVSLALTAYLMAVIIFQNRLNFSHTGYSTSAALVLVLLFLPLAVVVKEEISIRTQKQRKLHQEPLSVITVELPAAAAAAPPAEETLPVSKPQQAGPVEKEKETKSSTSSLSSSLLRHVIRILKSPERGEDYTILQALVSIDMLILFLATICGVGGTTTAIHNMGQIGQSLGYPTRSISTLVSLISIWNYCGRFASEIFLARYKFPRPFMLTLVLFLSCVGQVLITSGVDGSLYATSVILGFCLGAHSPLLFATISEVFGLKYNSLLYNFGAAAIPLGSYLLNVRVVGHLYDVEAERQKAAGMAVAVSTNEMHDLPCVGVECFRQSFLFIAAVTALGAGMLFWRTSLKAGEQAEAAEAEMATASDGGVFLARLVLGSGPTTSTAATTMATGESEENENTQEQSSV